jgi:hypothetical protein
VTVYIPSYTGLGKTYEILGEIKSKNKQPVFFPISGRVNSVNLFTRLKRMTEKKTEFSLIIQLY